ncbi:MAG: hypothetical protein WA722_00245, partial [Candidatus Sulfotelmatobacter sp.]
FQIRARDSFPQLEALFFNSRLRQEREHKLYLRVEMTQKTTSEKFLEQFCTQHGVQWEPIATEGTAGVKTPDYAIFPKDTKVITEVKEIRENATERQQRKQLTEVGWSMFGERNAKLGDRARDILTTAAKQLRRLAKGKSPALIVIYNPSFLLSHHTEPLLSPVLPLVHFPEWPRLR